jgi:hypothetical protein
MKFSKDEEGFQNKIYRFNKSLFMSVSNIVIIKETVIV